MHRPTIVLMFAHHHRKQLECIGLPVANSVALLQFKFPPTQSKLLDKFPVRRFDFDGRSLSEAGFELLNGLLSLDPERRLTADQALSHRWYGSSDSLVD